MNYSLIYDRIIQRARDRKLTGYCESHHIVPRCMNGGDDLDNMVDLTPEEHFLCHQLLVKIFRNTKYFHSLVFAANMMTRGNALCRRDLSKLKMYGWLRRAYSTALSERMTGTTGRHSMSDAGKEAVSKAQTGRTRSDEWKEQASILRKGKPGKPRSEATRLKISASKTGVSTGLGKPPTKGMTGKKHSLETLEKMRLARIEHHKRKKALAI